MADYLKDRKQFVKVEGYKSEEYYTRSGVSQGSTLGPLQFLIMINDLPNVISNAKCLMFADDLKLYLSVTEAKDCVALQHDINAVVEWSIKNKLSFNHSKCRTITLSRSRNPIPNIYNLAGAQMERVSSIKDLGVIMDSKLNFHDHILKTCKDANKCLGFIIRISAQFQNTQAIKQIYNAYVRSKLEYNAIVWSPQESGYSVMLEKNQRKFCRYLYKRQYGYYPYLYPSMFVSGMVDLDTLQLRRESTHIINYCHILVDKVDSPVIRESIHFYVPDQYMRGVGRRQHRLLCCPPMWRSPRADNSPTARAIKLMNEFLRYCPDADIFFDCQSVILKHIYIYLNVKIKYFCTWFLIVQLLYVHISLNCYSYLI